MKRPMLTVLMDDLTDSHHIRKPPAAAALRQ
jgi:hypothetical protein